MKKFLLLFIISTTLSFAQDVKTTFTYLVHKPNKLNKHTPILIVMHGYQASELDLFEFSKEVGKDYLIFSLQAPLVTKSGGYCWFDLQFLPNQKFKYDYKQTEEARNKVLAFIRAACLAYKTDSTNVFLLGFSQGAAMAYDIAVKAPEKIKGIVALSGVLIPETYSGKINEAALTKVKVFVAHGTADNIVNINDSQKSVEFLKSKKIENISYTTYDVGHSFHPNEVKDILNWLEKNKK